jgi:hypothetical protein
VYLICHPMQYRYIMNLRRHSVGHNDSLVGSVDDEAGPITLSTNDDKTLEAEYMQCSSLHEAKDGT